MATVLVPSPIKDNKRSRGNPNWVASLSYEEVKEIIRPYQFKSLTQYSLWVRDLRSEGKGKGLPVHAHAVYSRRGEWVSKRDFLGLPTTQIKHIQIKKQNPLRTIIRQILGLGK